MAFCLISGLARSLCASATPCNLSNVTNRTHVVICSFALFGDSTSLRKVLKWVKMSHQPEKGAFWHFVVCCQAYVHCQQNVTHPLSQIGHNVVTCNLVRIGDATSLNKRAQMVEKWPKSLQIAKILWPFALFRVWHAAYVHPQRHTTCPMSEMGPNMIICNLVRIGHSTSLHMSTHIGKNGQSPSNLPILAPFWCVARPMCIPNAM